MGEPLQRVRYRIFVAALLVLSQGVEFGDRLRAEFLSRSVAVQKHHALGDTALQIEPPIGEYHARGILGEWPRPMRFGGDPIAVGRVAEPVRLERVNEAEGG